jgi:hypothetical protein
VELTFKNSVAQRYAEQKEIDEMPVYNAVCYNFSKNNGI